MVSRQLRPLDYCPFCPLVTTQLTGLIQGLDCIRQDVSALSTHLLMPPPTFPALQLTTAATAHLLRDD